MPLPAGVQCRTRGEPGNRYKICYGGSEDEKKNNKKNKISSDNKMSDYNKITVPDLNTILISLNLRKSNVPSTNSGGTKAQKIQKILNAKGGKKMLDSRLKAGKGIKSKAEQQKAVGAGKTIGGGAPKGRINTGARNVGLESTFLKRKMKKPEEADPPKKLVKLVGQQAKKRPKTPPRTPRRLSEGNTNRGAYKSRRSGKGGK